MKPLYKTLITIWSEDDTSDVKLSRLGKDVDTESSYCSLRECMLVENPEEDEDWDDNSFFEDDEDDLEDDEDGDDEEEEEDDEDDDDLEEDE